MICADSMVPAFHVEQVGIMTKGTFSIPFSKSTANFKPRLAVSGSPFAAVAKIDLK